MTAVTPELLRRFDVPGPRYTSFPTADRFVEAFGAEDYILALQQRKSSTAARATPLSLYVHVPFCESLCYYCACRSEEHTSELQSPCNLVCRLLLEKKKSV